MDEKLLLPEGTYYQFVGEIIYKDGDRIFVHNPVRNPERFFGYLIALNVSIIEAWYRMQESNCRGYDVVINSSLLIRVRNRVSDEMMEELGFIYTDYPSVGKCPYNVMHYSFD
jgi:hypothetical protein